MAWLISYDWKSSVPKPLEANSAVSYGIITDKGSAVQIIQEHPALWLTQLELKNKHQKESKGSTFVVTKINIVLEIPNHVSTQIKELEHPLEQPTIEGVQKYDGQ